MPFLPTFPQLTNSTKKDSGDFLHHVCWLYYQRHLSQKWQQGRWIHLHIIRLTGNKLRFISSQIHLADFFLTVFISLPFSQHVAPPSFKIYTNKLGPASFEGIRAPIFLMKNLEKKLHLSVVFVHT